MRIGNGDTKSWFVINEIDTVFRKQFTFQDSDKATPFSAVNQILPKFDGVNAILNDLLIGMTNRQELLDDALLRPGRLEVQKYIPLHNLQGRYMGCLISLIIKSCTIAEDDALVINDIDATHHTDAVTDADIINHGFTISGNCTYLVDAATHYLEDRIHHVNGKNAL